MERGAWGAAVRGVAESWIQLKQLSTHTKALSLNTVTFRAGASTYGFDTFQFLTSRQTEGVL